VVAEEISCVCVCVYACGFGVLFIHIETSGSSYLPLSHDDDVMLVGMKGRDVGQQYG